MSGGAGAGERWHTVRVRPSGDPAPVIAALFAAGSQGVQELGDAVLTHFPPDADVARVREGVADADPQADVEVGRTVVPDWSEAWRSQVGAHVLGALAVVPPWMAAGRDPARTIVIDPGMAFGTGEHATTRGVVHLMQHVMRPGDVVADVGAGSAVLAIAAAKLGAARVAAIEIDAEAIGNAEENVARNGVADRVSVIHGDAGSLLPLVAPVRVVLANIISSVITQLLPTIERALGDGGRVIVSGLLTAEREQMLDVLGSRGWRVDAEDVEDVWWSASIARV